MTRNSYSTVAFVVFVVCIMVTDHILVEALRYIKHNQQFHLPLHGFTRNISDTVRAQLDRYSTESCLATPRLTSADAMAYISMLLFLAMLSCVLQVLMEGIRAKLCSLFYPDRVEERADYLYFRIVTGRINRRTELALIVRREIERRDKLVRFSPFQRFRFYLRGAWLKRVGKIVCPGCSRRVKVCKTKNISLNVFGMERTERICSCCHLDFSSKYNNSSASTSSGFYSM